jgi:2-(3-amino-3-carboxypropyl)histidine synthase
MVMRMLRMTAPYTGKVALSEEAIKELSDRARIIAIYTSVQFCHRVKDVVKQLRDAGIEVVSSQPDRCSEPYQILGCDVFRANLRLEKNPELFLYLGDGDFHPRALLPGQKDAEQVVPVFFWNPASRKLGELTVENIRPILRRLKGNLMRFLSSRKVGIISTIKPGQQQYRASLRIEKMHPGKRFYHFVDDAICFQHLEQFPFIDVWITSACPRIAMDDAVNFSKPMISLSDALQARELLSGDCMLMRVGK